ncbi:MAG: hypothetical protein JSW00_04735 [Thermoplasmata archaeon]|nr:MAG: hypothetical protein JSW00_04735 [Thermoplasmata archaeon]
MSEELDFILGLFDRGEFIALFILVIVVVISYISRVHYYRRMLKKTSSSIHVAPISVKGEISEWLGPDEAGLILREHLSNIADTFQRARSGHSSYYMDQALGSDLLGVFSASVGAHTKVVPSEDNVPTDLVLKTPGFTIPVGAMARFSTWIKHKVPIPYRNQYEASIIYVSLVSHSYEAQVHVCMGTPSGISFLKQLNRKTKQPLCSSRVRVETKKVNDYEDLKDLLREAAFYVLELHPKAFPGRDGCSIRCLADGLYAVDEYGRTGKHEKLVKAKERFSKTDEALVEDPATLYFYGCLFFVDRTPESIPIAIKLFKRALRAIEVKRDKITEDLKQALANEALKRPLTSEDMRWIMESKSLIRTMKTKDLKRILTIKDLKSALNIKDSKPILMFEDLIKALTTEDLKQTQITEEFIQALTSETIKRPLRTKDMKLILKTETLRRAFRIKGPTRTLTIEDLLEAMEDEDLKQTLTTKDLKQPLMIEHLINIMTIEDLKLGALCHVGLANCYGEGLRRLAKQMVDTEEANNQIKIAISEWEKTWSKELHPWILVSYAFLNHVNYKITNTNRNEMRGRYIESARTYLKAIKMEPDNGTLLNDLGYVLMKLAQWKAEPLKKEDKIPSELLGNPAVIAKKYLTESLRINKDNKLTHSNLCLLYSTPYYRQIDSKKYLEQCRFYGEKAIQIDPKYIDGHRDLAFSLALYHMFEDAYKHYEKALELSDNVDKDQEIMQEAEKILKYAGANDAIIKRWLNPDPILLSPPDPGHAYTSRS